MTAALHHLASSVLTPDAPPVEDSLFSVFESRFVGPLISSRDSEEWIRHVDALLPDWKKLRAGATVHLLEGMGYEGLARVNAEAAVQPLTLLTEPAAGAARFARDVAFRFSAEILRGGRHETNPPSDVLYAVVDCMARLELCWITLVRPSTPRPDVAEEAAWEAYANARELRRLSLQLGLDASKQVKEHPSDTYDRARAMLKRVAAADS